MHCHHSCPYFCHHLSSLSYSKPNDRSHCAAFRMSCSRFCASAGELPAALSLSTRILDFLTMTFCYSHTHVCSDKEACDFVRAKAAEGNIAKKGMLVINAFCFSRIRSHLTRISSGAREKCCCCCRLAGHHQGDRSHEGRWRHDEGAACKE